MKSNYPKAVTTNDGLRMYFKNEADHIAAYKKEPRLFHDVPDGISEIIPPVVVAKLMEEVAPVEVEAVIETPANVESELVSVLLVEKKRGWQKGRKRG